MPSTLETTGIYCTSVLFIYLSVIFVCVLTACLSRCLPSNQFSSHHSMTDTCYIPGMSTGICFHVAGNECQDFHMMKQKGGGYVFQSVRALLLYKQKWKGKWTFQLTILLHVTPFRLFTGSSANDCNAKSNARSHGKPGERENYCVSPTISSFPDITT